MESSSLARELFTRFETGQAGNSATSTRTIIIEAPNGDLSDAPPLAPTDTPDKIPGTQAADPDTDDADTAAASASATDPAPTAQ